MRAGQRAALVVAVAGRVRRQLLGDWFDGVLTSACGAATLALLEALQGEGIPSTAVDGYFAGPITRRPSANARRIGLAPRREHSWVRVGRKILDVTATQYGHYPAIWFPADARLYRRFHPGLVATARFRWDRRRGPHYVVNP